MKSFKSLYRTELSDTVFVETFFLEKKDFHNLDISPPKHGKGFMVTCSDTSLFHGLILLDESEEKAKHSHDCTVKMVQKSLKS